MTADRAHLLASLATALADTAPDVRVKGGRPRGTVTVRARADDPLRGRWQSEATFEADAGGDVALATARPAAGSYSAVDPFGLLWSLERDPASLPPAGFARSSEPEARVSNKIQPMVINSTPRRSQVRETPG